MNIFPNTNICNFIFWDSVDFLKVVGCGADFILVLITLLLTSELSVINLILSFVGFRFKRSTM
jgi:hypothetical protein